MILSGCGAGKLATPVLAEIPDQPPDCAVREDHAPLTAGVDKVVTLRLERGQLDKANDRVTRCYEFNRDVRARLRG